MKLTKLFLLIPLFTMVACSGKGGESKGDQSSTSSEEEVYTYEVSEDEFTEQITNRGIISLDSNRTFLVRGTYGDGGKISFTGKVDSGKYESEFRMYTDQGGTSQSNHVMYVVDQSIPPQDETYICDFYNSDNAGGWIKQKNKAITFFDLMVLISVLYNYDYDDFKYNENAKQYESTLYDVPITIMEIKALINSAKFQFKNGSLANYHLLVTVPLVGLLIDLNGEVAYEGETTVNVPEI